MEESVQNPTIIEQKDDFMISPTGGLATFRKAHFLKPTVSSIDGPPLKFPSLTSKPKWPLEVYFNGWSTSLKKWNKWVRSMHSRYSSLWKETGIYEAVMGSTFKISRNDGLILGIAERWCSDTNTFIFPWGEATITLEDVLILGGFSVLGDPVFLPLETKELIEIRDFFEAARKNLEHLKKDSHLEWLYLFMGTNNPFEHEAFLSLWLSRYVFPGDKYDKIFSNVFTIAIHLARGRRLALGPTILASIYRDLGLLREAIGSAELNEDYCLSLTLWSPLHLVQVWSWERLSPLRPKPNFIGPDEARMSRWDGEKENEIGNERPAINSAGVIFLWRPYTIRMDDWSLPKFYKENESWPKREDLSLELESFFRCLRPCVLVGVDCQEPYNPHRVAMQFGFDQDLPGWIPREQIISEIAWWNYNKPLSDDEILYIPSRLSESDVSIRYLEWWRNTVLCPVSPFMGILKGLRSCRKRRDFSLSYLKSGHDSKVSQDFVLKRPRNQRKNITSCEIGEPNIDNDLDAPPGFEHVHAARFHSLNDVVEARSNEMANKFNKTAKEESTSRKSVDVPPGFGSSTKFNIRKRNENSDVEPLPTKDNLARKNGKLSQRIMKTKSLPGFGFVRKAPPVPKQIVESITGAGYLKVVTSKRESVFNESKRLGNGSSNFDVARISYIEAHVSSIEGEVAALKSERRKRSGVVSDIEARVESIKARVSKIEEELAALKNGET